MSRPSPAPAVACGVCRGARHRVVVPAATTLPEAACRRRRGSFSTRSVAVAEKETVAPAGLVAFTTIGDGTVSCGGVVSTTWSVKLFVLLFLKSPSPCRRPSSDQGGTCCRKEARTRRSAWRPDRLSPKVTTPGAVAVQSSRLARASGERCYSSCARGSRSPAPQGRRVRAPGCPPRAAGHGHRCRASRR